MKTFIEQAEKNGVHRGLITVVDIQNAKKVDDLVILVNQWAKSVYQACNGYHTKTSPIADEFEKSVWK